MTTTTRKNSRTISFTQNADDKALLATIEQVLAEQKYASFDDLGKSALRQLLTMPAQTTAPTAPNEQSFTLLQEQLERIEQMVMAQAKTQTEERLASLVQLFVQLSENVTQSLADLQNHLVQLRQAVEVKSQSHEAEFADQLSRLALQVDRLEHTGRELETADADEAVVAQPRELDPVLQRLTTLLENF